MSTERRHGWEVVHHPTALIHQALPEYQGQFSVEKLERGQNNPTVSLYRIRGSEPLIIKAFDKEHTEDANRDIEQYEQVAHLPFVSKLRHIKSVSGNTFLGYEWIDGVDLFDYFNTLEGHDRNTRERLVRKTVEQTLHMGNAVSFEYHKKLKDEGTSVSITRHLYDGLLPLDEQSKFYEDYEIVLRKLRAVSGKFPGLYIDRNPGNAVLHREDETENLYQVDFGRMEGTSPLFDLGMLFRSQTGEPSVVNLETEPDLYVPTYDPIIERTILDYTYDLFTDSSKHAWTGTKDEFDRDYALVTFHQHLYFQTKAEGLLRKGGTNPKVQRGRKLFHGPMLESSYEQLLDMGEPVEELRPWVEKFVEL